MKIIGIITITAALLFWSALMNGWALAKLWAWFIAPTFGLPLLSIPVAIGVALVVGYLTYQTNNCEEKKKEYWESLVEVFVIGTFRPLFAVLAGAIVKSFI